MTAYHPFLSSPSVHNNTLGQAQGSLPYQRNSEVEWGGVRVEWGGVGVGPPNGLPDHEQLCVLV